MIELNNKKKRCIVELMTDLRNIPGEMKNKEIIKCNI